MGKRVCGWIVVGLVAGSFSCAVWGQEAPGQGASMSGMQRGGMQMDMEETARATAVAARGFGDRVAACIRAGE